MFDNDKNDNGNGSCSKVLIVLFIIAIIAHYVIKRHIKRKNKIT